MSDARSDTYRFGTWFACLGLFLVGLGLYALTGPGRIDIVDGQARYDVAYNLVQHGLPVIRDPAPLPGVLGPDGEVYAFYGPAASVFAMPLVWLGIQLGPPTGELARYLFSFTSALFAAMSVGLLAGLYTLLGVTRLRALLFAAVYGFATLTWPLATSTFDQAQHGFFLLLATLSVLQAARGQARGERDRSMGWATLAGLACAVIITYQEFYVVVVPWLALMFVPEGERLRLAHLRSKLLLTFAATASIGLVVYACYNILRFGGPLVTGKFEVRHTLLGNPIAGVLSLIASPGKSIFLYSPPLILAAVGWRGFVRAHRRLGQSVTLVVLSHFALISSTSFFGGDWCWGPRYFVVTLPLLALAFPFVPAFRAKRAVWAIAIATGIGVQVLSLGVDHHRFFLERSLVTFFWEDPWVYFRKSALFARPAEFVSVARGEIPAEAVQFSPGSYPSFVTYTVSVGRIPYGSRPEQMKRFAVFYLPRPWPLWMRWIPAANRPVPLGTSIGLLALTTTLGAAMIGLSLLRAKSELPINSDDETRTGC